jgi:hypothetical protein
MSPRDRCRALAFFLDLPLDLVELLGVASDQHDRSVLGQFERRGATYAGGRAGEFIRPASSTSSQDIKRIDYLSFQRVEGRWKYVSIEMRPPVGIMPAYSFDRGDAAGVLLVRAVRDHGRWVRRGGQMLRMNTVVTRDGPDRDV